MYPRQHLIYGIIFAFALFLLFPTIDFVAFSIIVFSTVLIDVDHYIYYVFKKKDFNLSKAIKECFKIDRIFYALPREKRNKVLCGIFFLHNIELLIILFLISFLSKYFFFIFVGFAFHLLLDLVDQTVYHEKIDKLSIIFDFLKSRKYKNIWDVI